MTREETGNILNDLAIAYPAWKIKDPKKILDLWHECLAEFENEEVRRAMIKIIKTDESIYAPSIGRLINAIGKSGYKGLVDRGDW